MSTFDKNLSLFNASIPDGTSFRIGIVCSEWNQIITSKLLDGAINLLKKSGVLSENLSTRYVPGAYELALGAQKLVKNPEIDGVICLGCVVKGETPHFDFICQAAANGIIEVGLKFNKPVIFGVLTTNTIEQAEDRAGGKHGNKGDEAAFSLLKMLS